MVVAAVLAQDTCRGIVLAVMPNTQPWVVPCSCHMYRQHSRLAQQLYSMGAAIHVQKERGASAHLNGARASMVTIHGEMLDACRKCQLFLE